MIARTTWLIQPIGFESPVEQAARQLCAYLPRTGPVAAGVLPVAGVLPPDTPAHIVLGTSRSLRGVGLGTLPKGHELDDAIAIIPKKGRLFLVGSNARSVLYAAYRLLEQFGVVFLRPGPGGEVVPRKAVLQLPRRAVREKASYRHRGICIEGSPRLEHVLDLLDWMAKKKMNTFQLQFRHAGVFWRRGYNQSPEADPSSRAKRLSEQDCVVLDDRVVARCKELGMIVHRVGHGWTAMTLGYKGTDWNEPPGHPLPPAMRPWVAEVRGKRDIFRNEPSNTELCYSNPQAREAFMAKVLDYARRHREVDALHVWLSDATNNKCECPDCRKLSPTDQYMEIVNELGRRLKQEGLETRIVFLGYFELIWPPDEVRLTADNAIFMYAPMGRCYRHSIADEKCGETHDLERPPLNESRPLGGNRTVSALARRWKEVQPPDSFLFDYHMWAAVWSDGLGTDIGAVMARDMKEIRDLGLNGLVSCQCIRAFYPHPYVPNAMADTLWNRQTPPAAHRRRIMSAAFGKHVDEVERYFAALVKSSLLGPSYRHQTLLNAPRQRRSEIARTAETAGQAQRRFGALARAERDLVIKTSLELMSLHAEQTVWVAKAYLAGMRGDRKLIVRMRGQYERRLPEVLGQFAPWVDPMVGRPVFDALWAAERLARGGAHDHG